MPSVKRRGGGRRKKKYLEASDVQALENTSITSPAESSALDSNTARSDEKALPVVFHQRRELFAKFDHRLLPPSTPLSPSLVFFVSIFFFFFIIRKSVYGAPVDREPVSMGTAAFQTHQTRA